MYVPSCGGCSPCNDSLISSYFNISLELCTYQQYAYILSNRINLVVTKLFSSLYVSIQISMSHPLNISPSYGLWNDWLIRKRWWTSWHKNSIPFSSLLRAHVWHALWGRTVLKFGIRTFHMIVGSGLLRALPPRGTSSRFCSSESCHNRCIHS